MDKHHYSKTTLSVFEIIAAYFANIAYNHLYIEAKKIYGNSERDDRSLTDAYKTTLFAYQQGITTKPKFYEKTIMDILEHYRVYTRFSTASMEGFIDKVIQQFIPEEHFGTLGEQEKYFFLNKIVSSIV